MVTNPKEINACFRDFYKELNGVWGVEGRGTTFKVDTVAARLLVLVETLLDLTSTQLLSMAPRSRVRCGHTTANCFDQQAELDKGRQGVFGPW